MSAKENTNKTGYVNPSVVIEPPRRVIERRNGEFLETEEPAWVKLSTGFKDELAVIDESALKVWLYIALSINRHDGRARPGVRTIAANTNLSPNTVTAAIKRLEEQYGLLVVNREDRKYNIYEPLAYISAGKGNPASKFAPDNVETVANSATDGIETVANFATDNTETVAKNGETVAKKRQTVANRLRLNQINQINHNTGAIAPDAPESPALTDEEKIARFYPEDVQEALRWFWELWRVPVPERSKNGRGGQHALWIKEMRLLVKVCGPHGRAAFEAVHKTWKRSMFTVSHPGAIYRTLSAEVGILNQRQTEQPVQEQPPVVEPLQSRNTPPPGWKEFKRRLEERHAQRSTMQS